MRTIRAAIVFPANPPARRAARRTPYRTHHAEPESQHPGLPRAHGAGAGCPSGVPPATFASTGCGPPPGDRRAARSARFSNALRGKRSHRRPDEASCSASPVQELLGSPYPSSAAGRAVPVPVRRSGPRPHALPSYFEPMVTTRRLRPFRRRRFSASRPARVLIRARNPCLFFRLRLRGLYVGFPICVSSGSLSRRAELGIISARWEWGQLSAARTRVGADVDLSTTRV